MKANFNKPIFDHTHNRNDKWIVISGEQYFCLKCAGICQLVPIHILPPWIREGKRKAPQIDITFRKTGDDLPIC